MSSKKKDFYGKEVTDAIKKACDELGVAQEQLDIEVVETGSMGIFGLIRKKARIRAGIRAIPAVDEEVVISAPVVDHSEKLQASYQKRGNENGSEYAEDTVEEQDYKDETVCDDVSSAAEEEQVSEENLQIVETELSRLLELMGFPSVIHIEASGISVHCCIAGAFEEALTGQDGKTLDSLQYLLRKIIARKITGRLRLSLDIGDFRERRQQELAEKAVQLAHMVKEDGKTQIIAALNPSERRVVHMTLQEDKEIRSRSVGEGLFKKILIYKPGKGKKNSVRKQHSPRGRKAKNDKSDTERNTTKSKLRTPERSGVFAISQQRPMSRSSACTTTIAAISTPPGAGGIGIIRMSGPQSLHTLQTIFKPHSPSCPFASHQLYYGRIVRPVDGKIMDEVLVVYMRSPRTYTREDVTEIHCHGSYIVLRNILELVLSLGVSLANPGEFTKRAYLNGRIDLTQAEAVIDILTARTRKGVDLAQEQLAGALFSRIDLIRNELIRMRALVEVAIDFPDEDVDIINPEQLQEQLRTNIAEPLRKLLQGADNGKIFRDGISVVIVGLPNVGKSSLLNAILQEDRALVTAIPGTTRDTIEEYVDIEGIPVRIIDTAGIREHADEVEALGIERARTQINQADLILFMVDGSQKLTVADVNLFRAIDRKSVIVVLNKIDLINDNYSEDYGLFQGRTQVRISARQRMGIAALKNSIFEMAVEGKEQWQEDACAPNIRHKDALIRAQNACERVKDGLQGCLTNDLLAVDLQECLDQLDDIVGTTTADDILDAIFTKFCIGK